MRGQNKSGLSVTYLPDFLSFNFSIFFVKYGCRNNFMQFKTASGTL